MTPPNVAIYLWIRQAFDFQGRATRSDYWWPRLLVTIVNTSLGILFLQGGGDAWFELLIELSRIASETGEISAEDLALPPLTSLGTFALTASCVFVIFTFIPMLALSWRRFQDLNAPGWIHVLVLLACGFVSQLVLLFEFVWFAFPGTNGPNQYGPDKRGSSPNIY